jgi:hypothetical protein
MVTDNFWVTIPNVFLLNSQRILWDVPNSITLLFHMLWPKLNFRITTQQGLEFWFLGQGDSPLALWCTFSLCNGLVPCVNFKKKKVGLSCIYSINGGGGANAKHLYASILRSAQFLKKIVMGQSKWLLDFIYSECTRI